MFWKVVRATAALAAVAVASSDMPLGPQGGGADDSYELTNNNTDAAVFGITDREIVLDQRNSMAERKRSCPRHGGNPCRRAGGSCVNNAEAKDCDGLVIPSICEGSSCKCCIPDRCSHHQNITCPDKFENIGNCCYYFSVNNAAQKSNWPDAKASCKALGREHNMDIDLFEIGTGGCEGDANLMMEIAEKRAYTWAGANSLDRGANWQWERTGDVLPHNFNMWWHNDPRTDNANCMQAFITSWTTWRAVFGIAQCATQMNHYVCQVFK